MRKTLNTLRFVRTFLALVRDPGQLERVFALADRVVGDDLFERMPWLRGRPEIEAVVRRPSRRLRWDPARLSALPVGTLGRTFIDFLARNGLEPESLAHDAGESTLQRFRVHLQSTHDLWHVVTGFGTDVDGEIGLQGFYFAQLSSPLPLALLSAGLLNSLLVRPGSGAARVESMVRGYLMGRRAEPLTGIDWTEHWDAPLDELRRSLRVDLQLDPLIAGAPGAREVDAIPSSPEGAAAAR